MALYGHPPLQPRLAVEQSTNYYSESDINEPEWILWKPSTAPVVEKAQHEPHEP